MMDILRPFLRVHEKGTHLAVACDLGDIRLPMAEQTVLISIVVRLRIRVIEKEAQRDKEEQYAFIEMHACKYLP